MLIFNILRYTLRNSSLNCIRNIFFQFLFSNSLYQGRKVTKVIVPLPCILCRVYCMLFDKTSMSDLRRLSASTRVNIQPVTLRG